MNELTILAIVIVGGVFGIGFFGLAIYMTIDKTPSGKTTHKPPITLKKQKKMKKVINVIHCYVSEAEQFFCWDKRGKLSKRCYKQCNICFRYERNNKKNCP